MREPHTPLMRSTSVPPHSSPNARSAGEAALRQRIESREATIAIVGLGYVGLPLARAIFDAGYKVLGFDVDHEKIEKLARGEPYLQHLGSELIQPFVKNDRFRATSQSQDLAEADAIILCVPTPLGQHNEPDISYVVNSTKLVAEILRRGQLI